MIWVENAILSFLEVFLCLLFLSIYMEIQEKFLRLQYCMAAAIGALGMAVDVFFPNKEIHIGQFCIVILAICIYSGHTVRRIAIGLLYLAISIMTEQIMEVLFLVVGKRAGTFEEYGDFRAYLILMASYLVKFMVIYFWKTYKEKQETKERRSVDLILPVIAVGNSIYMTMFLKEELPRQASSLFFCYLGTAYVTVLNMVIYYLLGKIDGLRAEKKHYFYAIQELKQKETYYKNMEEHHKEIRIIKHDLQNQLTVLDGYMQLEKWDKAKKELESMMDDVNGSNQKYYTSNIGVNTILNAKEKEMKEKNIRCCFEIQLPKKLNITNRDMTGVLGNILDNAIEASARCEEERFVELMLYYKNHFIVLECTNSANRDVQELHTIKADKRNHGWGMKSIEQIVEKYNGSTEWKCENREFKMEICLRDF